MIILYNYLLFVYLKSFIMKRFYIVLLSFLMLIGIGNRVYAQSPSLTTSYPTIVQGDSIVFSYSSPNFSSTDKIAIYPLGTIPGSDNTAIDWKYIPNSIGSITFKTNLDASDYDAYLLCCDGYESLATTTFEIINPLVAFVSTKKIDYDAGETLEFYYNDPEFVAGDQIAIYVYGEPTTGPSITYSQVVSQWGIVSFPGVLAPGAYNAVLLSSSSSEYARSEAFIVPEGGTGSYIKTAASVYPGGTPILVNYKDLDYSSTDWIGIYKKGQLPGGDPESTLWQYAASDSSTIEFESLPFGDYVVFLLCCDGYEVKARYDFKVVGPNTHSLVLNAFAYEVGDPIEFTYNDPNVATGGTAEWIGIYYKGDIPADVRSLVWDYLTEANGTMTFSVPYPNGTWLEDQPDVPLQAGEYFAGLFCCDTYGLHASTSFTVREVGTGVTPEFSLSKKLALYPNPTSGLVNVTISNTDQLKKIVVYSLTGQVLHEEKLNGVYQKTLDLKFLDKGVYFIEAQTDKYKTSKKLIIK